MVSNLRFLPIFFGKKVISLEEIFNYRYFLTRKTKFTIF